MCVAPNDPFVVDAWGKGASADGKVVMLADTQAELTKALGLEAPGLDSVLGGTRMRRCADSRRRDLAAALLPARSCAAAPRLAAPRCPAATHAPCARCSFSAVVEAGTFKTVNLEEGGGLTCSLSNVILSQLTQ